jgi:hypothetical protein
VATEQSRKWFAHVGRNDSTGTDSTGQTRHDRSSKRRKKWQRTWVTLSLVGLAVLVATFGLWLAGRAVVIKDNLEAANTALNKLQATIRETHATPTAGVIAQLQENSSAAKNAASDPLWRAAAGLPWIGANFSAITETASSVDDIVDRAVIPLTKETALWSSDTLAPSSGSINLERLKRSAPQVISAARVVSLSQAKLAGIDSSVLLPDVADPLGRVKDQLAQAASVLQEAASAAQLAPGMLGAEERRSYLLIIQNNAESRATGGIPGALAVLNVNNGTFTLDSQSSASALDSFSPALTVNSEQELIYSNRIGRFMQDVNLTPDFPTAATTASAMWQRRTGQHVDGVISIDPVALSYMLDATGPVKLTSPELVALANGALPTEMTGENVVRTLLSDVYAKIAEPTLQDAYFAGVAKEIFATLTKGKGDAKDLVQAITRGTEEGRVLLWSATADEQAVLAKYPVSGSIAGPSISPAQFGVYFNDGTGAKMDYYVKRTAQLVQECPRDGYREVKVRVTSTNTAPADAATSLPEYVTGGGIFGVPAGTVQTNIVAYGPVQSNVETAFVGGKKMGFASQRHNGRPVGVVTVRLAPGQSSSVEFTFGKIVQHAEPNLAVTPTVQALKDVLLDTVSENCVPAA